MPPGEKSEYPKRFREPEAIRLIAENVRMYRKEKGVSMELLANLVGIEYSVIARLEMQKTNPTISLVYAIGKALEIEPYQLLVNPKA